jgi:hypothetical protein
VESSPPQPDTKWNQKQTENKKSGKDQKEQDSDVRMGRSWQEDFIKPESNRGKCCAGGDRGARERERILAQKIEWLGPVSDAFSQSHWKLLPFLPHSFYAVAQPLLECAGVGIRRYSP